MFLTLLQILDWFILQCFPQNVIIFVAVGGGGARRCKIAQTYVLVSVRLIG